MPPNRKEVGAVVVDVDVSGLTRSAKFAPLTEAFLAPPKQEVEVPSFDGNESYWDWAQDDSPEEVQEKSEDELSKEAVIEKILKEEADRQILSLANVEKHLVTEGKLIENESQVPSKIQSQYSSNDYWDFLQTDEQVEKDQTTSSAPQTAKKPLVRLLGGRNEAMDKGAEERSKIISEILQEEAARQFFMASSIEQQLMSAACGSDTLSAETEVIEDCSAQSEAQYWDWSQDSPSVSRSQTSQVEMIMKEEQLRQYFAIENVERKLFCSVQEETMIDGVKNEEFWRWVSCQEDELRAAPFVVAARPDAPGDVSHREELAQVDPQIIIKKIIEQEELRREFLVGRIEQYLTTAATVPAGAAAKIDARYSNF